MNTDEFTSKKTMRIAVAVHTDSNGKSAVCDENHFEVNADLKRFRT